VDVLADRLDRVTADRDRWHAGRTGQDMLVAARDEQRVAHRELYPFLCRRKQPATLLSDEVEPRRLLLGEGDGPRLAQHAAAVINAVEAQAAQHVGQWIARANQCGFGRIVIHLGVSSIRNSSQSFPILYAGPGRSLFARFTSGIA